jgi:hypothetical protein
VLLSIKSDVFEQVKYDILWKPSMVDHLWFCDVNVNDVSEFIYSYITAYEIYISKISTKLQHFITNHDAPCLLLPLEQQELYLLS